MPTIDVSPPASPNTAKPRRNTGSIGGARQSRPRRIPEQRSSTPPRGRTRRWWLAIAPLFVGTIVTLVGTFEYRAIAFFQTPPPVEKHRANLLDALWQTEREQVALRSWEVEPAGGGRLRAEIICSDRTAAETIFRQIAQTLNQRMEDEARRARQTPGLAERLVSELMARLEPDAERTHADLENHNHRLPGEEPSETQRRLQEALEAHTRSLASLRSAKQRVETRLDRLDRTPQPTSGWVDPDEKKAAHLAREDLRQDIEQLNMKLSLGRRHLAEVWQQASPRLDELVLASTKLEHVLGDNRRTGEAEQKRRNRIRTRSGHYRRRLESFARRWTETFTALANQPGDPLAPRLFHFQRRLADLLGEFSFHAGKLIDAMRDDVRELGNQTHDAARRHRIRSQVLRAFHRLESEHRQLEFVASDVLPRNNFRLDAAIRSARGLHYRVRQAVAAIDQRLEADAIARDRQQRQARRESLLKERERITGQVDDQMDTILSLQTELLDTIPQARDSLERAHRIDSLRRRLELLRKTFADDQELLAALRKQREAAQGIEPIRLMNYTIDQTPSNLPERLLWGGVAALITLLAMLSFQQRRA